LPPSTSRATDPRPRRSRPTRKRVSKALALTAAFAVASLVGAVGASAIAQGNPEAARMKNPVAATPDSLSEGKRLYQRHCASCHGSNAEGGAGNDLIPAAPDLTGKAWKHGSSDGEIFSSIKNGVPPELNMIPFGDQLKDTDIWNVVNYLRSIEKKS
jgi:mono/diheme cytochrome c family protein